MSRRTLKYYNGRSIGDSLTEDDCKILDKLMYLSENNGYVEDLKHCIYNLSPMEIESIKAMGNGDMIEKNIGTLSDSQTVGVAYMYYAKRVLMADSVGLGKTVMVCGLLNLLTLKLRKLGFSMKYLYFTEKNLVKETRDKMIKFTGEYADAIYGTKKDVERYISENRDDVNNSVVCSFSVSKNVAFQEYIKWFKDNLNTVPYDIMIVDEAGSALGNHKSDQYQTLKAIADMFDMVIIMNATPFEKDLFMMYNQLDFVDSSILPTRTAFNKKYIVYDYSNPFWYRDKTNISYKNIDELKNLIAYRCISRTRKSTGSVMEDCSAEVILSDLSPMQKVLLNETSIPNMVFDCPGYFNGGAEESTIENTPKLRDLLALVSKFTDMGESVLIYAIYKEAQYAIQNMLFEHGISCEVMNGETPMKERQKIIDEFKYGSNRVLITNVQKGLDFDGCNYCIFYGYDPSPSKMVQFEGRMTRDYVIRGKHVYFLISRGKELTKFKDIVRRRAVASDSMVDSDFSCVMELLLDDNKLANLK